MQAGQKQVICPYNKAHVIREERMQFHLKKCRLQAENASQVLICPFNSSHHIPKEKFKEHEAECPNRVSIDTFVYNMSQFNQSAATVPVGAVQLPPPEEDWGEETNYSTVSVLESIKESAQTKNVLLTTVGLPKAERKQHRINERLRHRQLFEAPKTRSWTEELASSEKDYKKNNPAQKAKNEPKTSTICQDYQPTALEPKENKQVKEHFELPKKIVTEVANPNGKKEESSATTASGYSTSEKEMFSSIKEYTAGAPDEVAIPFEVVLPKSKKPKAPKSTWTTAIANQDLQEEEIAGQLGSLNLGKETWQEHFPSLSSSAHRGGNSSSRGGKDNRYRK